MMNSARRMTTQSQSPPKYPASPPKNSAMKSEIVVPTNPMVREMRDPYSSLLKTSLPRLSVPKMNTGSATARGSE